MGRVEKPLQLLHGRPLIEHVTDRLRPQVGRLLISANREQGAYAPMADAVIPDAAGYEGVGPLGGVLAARPASPLPMYRLLSGDDPGDHPSPALH